MHFRHPELLYGLILLVLPVLVHLFRLRRFRPESFTNVKYLQKAISQTRRSSQLKKWLILVTRIFTLAGIILAFAQPYISPELDIKISQDTVIYLDNSYSMEARGKKGVLLKQGIQQLLENLPEEGRITLFTNDHEFRNLSTPSLREKLHHVKYSPGQLDWKNVGLKAQRLLDDGSASKNLLMISDFQKRKDRDSLSSIPDANNFWIKLEPENLSNVSLDSIYVLSRNPDEMDLRVELSSSGNIPDEISVSISDGSWLLSRKTAKFEEGSFLTMDFTLPTAPIKQGKVHIQDNGLNFDNTLYFSINTPKAIHVVVIGEVHNQFFHRIFTAPEFNIQYVSEKNIDYNALSEANLVILNEVQEIPPHLQQELIDLQKENTLLAIIPSEGADLNVFNSFLRQFSLPVLIKKIKEERLITDISFGHPLFSPVFEKEIHNFQYPRLDSYYQAEAGAKAVLSFDNGQPYLIEKNMVFLFTAPLNSQNSNFQNSPLIVPTFYNMGNLSLSLPQLYSTLGKEQELDLPVQLDKDEILKFTGNERSFIPRQHSFRNKVRLVLKDDQLAPGHYRLVKDSLSLMALSFNIDRKESNLDYIDLEASGKAKIFSETPNVFEEIRSAGEVTALWKWFVIFALIFLLIEMLILKFVK